MFFLMQKYIYSESVFNAQYIEIKQMLFDKTKTSSFFFEELQLITAFPANISCFPRRLEDVFKKCLQDLFQRRLQDVLKMSLQDVFKTFSRHLQDLSARRLLQDVLKTSSKRLREDVLQLCLRDVLKDKKMLR